MRHDPEHHLKAGIQCDRTDLMRGIKCLELCGRQVSLSGSYGQSRPLMKVGDLWLGEEVPPSIDDSGDRLATCCSEGLGICWLGSDCRSEVEEESIRLRLSDCVILDLRLGIYWLGSDCRSEVEEESTRLRLMAKLEEARLELEMMIVTANCKDLFLVCVIILCGLIEACQGGKLRSHFYNKTCPQAESIVKTITWSRVSTNPTLPAKLLRMHFHDCFVRGCDGSVLLNSTSNSTAEKDAPPNLSLSGFDVIDQIKTQLEKACPQVVSCADILALAARDSVSFQFRRSMWKVATGRRDGKVSLASEALANIPSPLFNFSSLKQSFASKGLDVHDLVVLSGGHTIGVGHCALFSNRLFNFTGKGDADPSLNSTYAAELRKKCKSLSDNTTTVPMDPPSPLSFDRDYYVILRQNKGLFQSDAALLTDNVARRTVRELMNTKYFVREFAKSMKKMGGVGVLTGTAGEIRKKCAVVN
ncbi:peroxidase 27-like [Malania oleifera]|uniref:peroxidase 27-like n=1 Tax=Malania oleifera TaxID=397392 RepID=UPI0025AEC3B0|nr:peroxidase 27-like [Malania oleifera]